MRFIKITIIILTFALLLSNASSIVFAVQNNMSNDLKTEQDESSKNEINGEILKNGLEDKKSDISAVNKIATIAGSENEQKLTSKRYMVDESNLLIKKVLPETDIVYFKTKFNISSDNIKVYEDVSCTKEVTTGIVKTRMAVKITNSSKVYKVCVIGDFNDDGKMAEIELNQVIKHVVGLKEHQLTGLELINADVNYDEKVDQIDITIIIRWIVYKELNVPAPPIIEVIDGEQNADGIYKTSVTVRIKEGNNQGVEVQKTTYSINYGEEIEIESGGTITLTKDGEYKIIAYTYLEEGIRSKSTKTIKIKNEKDINKLVIELDKDEFIYDGTPKEPKVTVKDGSKVLTKDVDYTVSYNDNINAGTATVTITGKEGTTYIGTVTKSFVIKKAESVNPTLTEVTATYDDAVHEIEVTGGTGGTIYYRTSTDGSTFGEWSTTKPNLTNAGKLYVQAYVKGDSNHNDTGATSSVLITVNKKAIAVKANAKTKVYGEVNPSFDYTHSGEISGQTAKFTGSLTTTATTTSNVGTYDITQGSLALTDNGTFLASNYTINYTKASLTITNKNASTFTVTVSPTSYIYDGTAKKPTVTVKDGSTTLTKDTHYTVSYSNNVNAGTATVTVTAKAGTNYTGTISKNFTINKAASTNPSLTAVTATYDGAAHTIGVSGGAGGTIYYRTSSDNTTFGSWTTTKPSLTNVGKVYVQAYVKADGNHIDTSATSSALITINKKVITVKANAKTKAYGATNPTLDYTYSGVVSGQTAKFTGSLETTATTSSPVGTYDITQGNLALANNGTFLESNYTINYTKASLTVTAKELSTLTVTLSQSSYTYDGTAKTPTVTVKDGSTTLTKDTHYTVAYSNNVNAGTATVTVTGKGNYGGTTTKNFIINKATNPISVVGKTGLNYTGSSQQLVTVTNAQGTVYYSTSTVLTSSNYTSGSTNIPTGIASGDYTVYYYTPGNKNYAEKRGQVAAKIMTGVAKIGSTVYQSVQSAINAVPTNNVQTTITMLKSTTESVNISGSKNIILDLANYTLTGESGSTITSSGTLTVRGGTVTSAHSYTIKNDGTLNIVDTANITNTNTSTIYNSSILNMSGGTVTSYDTSILNYYGTLNISGGTVHSYGDYSITIDVSRNGTINISGTAHIISDNDIAVLLTGNESYNSAVLYMNGGTVESKNNIAIQISFGRSVTITGGTVKTGSSSSYAIYKSPECTATVSVSGVAIYGKTYY